MANIPDPMESRKMHIGVHASYWGLFIALLAWGYSIMDTHIVWASVLFAIAIAQLLLGMWLWFGSRWQLATKLIITVVTILGFGYLDYKQVIYELTPTYVYIVPADGLIDAERRPFFVEHSGPRTLSNVQIALRDNKAGAVHIDKYSEIGQANPVFSCRDRLLPSSYVLAKDSTQPCDRLKIPKETQGQLQPPPYNIQWPDGSLQVMRLRTLSTLLPPESVLEAESEDRHLWEYQIQQLKSEIADYSGSHILILATNGQKTQRYAKELGGAFRAAHWKVDGPSRVPPEDERIIDVQISTAKGAASKSGSAVLRGLTQAHVKHRSLVHSDTDIPGDLVVLWVGPRSPSGIDSDVCSPTSFKPQPGAHQPCDMIGQTPHSIPFVPP
jgi:hypothetical protein